MSTGAFLEFLTGMQGSEVPRNLGPGPAAEMLERRREPRLSACGPGPGPPGLGARPTRGLGPFPHKNPKPLYDFFANLLVKAWRRCGCRLKRLLRRWGPGGKRSRDTPPTPPPPPRPHPPPRFGAVREKGRGFSPKAILYLVKGDYKP